MSVVTKAKQIAQALYEMMRTMVSWVGMKIMADRPWHRGPSGPSGKSVTSGPAPQAPRGNALGAIHGAVESFIHSARGVGPGPDIFKARFFEEAAGWEADMCKDAIEELSACPMAWTPVVCGWLKAKVAYEEKRPQSLKDDPDVMAFARIGAVPFPRIPFGVGEPTRVGWVVVVRGNAWEACATSYGRHAYWFHDGRVMLWDLVGTLHGMEREEAANGWDYLLLNLPKGVSLQDRSFFGAILASYATRELKGGLWNQGILVTNAPDTPALPGDIYTLKNIFGDASSLIDVQSKYSKGKWGGGDDILRDMMMVITDDRLRRMAQSRHGDGMVGWIGRVGGVATFVKWFVKGIDQKASIKAARILRWWAGYDDWGERRPVWKAAMFVVVMGMAVATTAIVAQSYKRGVAEQEDAVRRAAEMARQASAASQAAIASMRSTHMEATVAARECGNDMLVGKQVEALARIAAMRDRLSELHIPDSLNAKDLAEAEVIVETARALALCCDASIAVYCGLLNGPDRDVAAGAYGRGRPGSSGTIYSVIGEFRQAALVRDGICVAYDHVSDPYQVKVIDVVSKIAWTYKFPFPWIRVGRGGCLVARGPTTSNGCNDTVVCEYSVGSKGEVRLKGIVLEYGVEWNGGRSGHAYWQIGSDSLYTPYGLMDHGAFRRLTTLGDGQWMVAYSYHAINEIRPWILPLWVRYPVPRKPVFGLGEALPRPVALDEYSEQSPFLPGPMAVGGRNVVDVLRLTNGVIRHSVIAEGPAVRLLKEYSIGANTEIGACLAIGERYYFATSSGTLTGECGNGQPTKLDLDPEPMAIYAPDGKRLGPHVAKGSLVFESSIDAHGQIANTINLQPANTVTVLAFWNTPDKYGVVVMPNGVMYLATAEQGGGRRDEVDQVTVLEGDGPRGGQQSSEDISKRLWEGWDLVRTPDLKGAIPLGYAKAGAVYLAFCKSKRLMATVTACRNGSVVTGPTFPAPPGNALRWDGECLSRRDIKTHISADGQVRGTWGVGDQNILSYKVRINHRGHLGIPVSPFKIARSVLDAEGRAPSKIRGKSMWTKDGKTYTDHPPYGPAVAGESEARVESGWCYVSIPGGPQ